jgi:hypothetical protein
MTNRSESKSCALINGGQKALAVANRQLRIAGQTLVRIEQERYIEFFATHPQASRAFVRAVSRYFPCSEALIGRYHGQWEWSRMSSNTAIAWTEGLIERYAHLWDWANFGLSQNEALPWSEALIDRYADRWDWGGHWGGLSKNQALPWSEALIERYQDRWGWGVYGLSSSQALPWSEPLIACYSDRWDWEWLSWNRALPWSEALIERYADRWDWSRLSRNEALPWSEALLLRYADRWKWECLSRNRVLPWSEAFLLRYADRWEWGWLSRNEALPWSEGLVDRHVERWDWWALSLNKGLPWSEALIERYAHRWSWLCLSQNQALPWTEALIDRYKDRWAWFNRYYPEDSDLSGNPALPWSIALIERYEERWQWGEDGLSTNKSLPWSIAFIERFQSRWNWGLLSWNQAIPWTEALIVKYADRWGWGWEKIPEIALSKILPNWSEASIRAVMDRMSHRQENGGDSIPAYCAANAVDQTETAPPHLTPAPPTGIDSELLQAGVTLAGWYIERGMRRFADVAARLAADLETRVPQFQDYLEYWYYTARDVLEDAGHDVSDMDDPDAVKRELERFVAITDQRVTTAPRPGPAQTYVASPLGVPQSEWNQASPDLAQRAPSDGLDQSSFAWLNTLFDSMPGENPLPVFDEETYAQARPHFIAMAAHLRKARDDVRELMRAIIRALRDRFGMSEDSMRAMKPYIVWLADEVEAGTIQLGGADAQFSGETVGSPSASF